MFNPPWHLVAIINFRLEVCSKSVRTRFLLGGVNVMVSWWSSGFDTHPDSERPGFDPLLRHSLWQSHHIIYQLAHMLLLKCHTKKHMDLFTLIAILFWILDRHANFSKAVLYQLCSCRARANAKSTLLVFILKWCLSSKRSKKKIAFAFVFTLI